MSESLKQKAKTFYELGKEWMKTKVDDSINNEKWIRLEDAQQEIDDCRTSWQNLKDTIPKFDHKISFLENQIKSDNELIEISQRARHELERERGLLKQKLRQTCDEIRSKLKFLDYEQYHGDLKQSLNPTLREINQLLEGLRK